ncbi:MAG: DUF262 domain-containing protein [Hyphomonadaceae bacterium]
MTALKVREATLQEVFADAFIAPAAVQRDYQWTEKECQALFDDLDRAFSRTPAGALDSDEDDAGEEVDEPAPAQEVQGDFFDPALTAPAPADRPYFLGALAFGPPDEGERDRLAVYDGLQRLTTLTIIFAVLRDLATDVAESERLHALVSARDGRNRIRLTVRDPTLATEAQQKGATRKTPSTPTPTDMGLRVRRAIRLFRRKFMDWPLARRSAFVDYILRQVIVVILETDNRALAFQMFVTTNTRGKTLQKSDILKGQIIDLVAQEQDSAAAERLAAQWTSVQRRLGNEFDEYVQTVDFLYRRKDQGEDYFSDLFETLKTNRKASTFVGRLADAVSAWTELTAHRHKKRPLDGWEAIVWRLSLLPWDDWTPAALAIIKDYPDQRTPLLAALERACIAMLLTDLARRRRIEIVGGALSKLYQRGGENWRPFLFTTQRRAKAVDLLTHTAIEMRVAKPLVRWLEGLRWGPEAPDYIANGTLEHVLPLTCKTGAQWEKDFPTAEVRQVFAEQLGNFAIIDKDANEQVSNEDFADKAPILRAQCDRYQLVREIAEQEVWQRDQISTRTRALANEVLAFLGQPGLT